MTIRDAIKEIMRQEIPPLSLACTVKSVDEDKAACDVVPIDGSADILDVLLLAEESDKIGLIKIPAVDSTVYVTFISKDIAFVSLFSDITKLNIQINDISLTVDQGQISLNGDNLGGLVDAGELKTQIDKNTEAIQAIQSGFNSWTVVPSDGGAALKATSLGFVSKDTADLSDIENETVKHGN